MTNDQDKFLQHPIPPPTHETQYRAIGLVWGVYQPEDDKLTSGHILLPENRSLETVLLGRVLSVIKKHIDLDEPHLWVVYPRTRQKEDYLHLQIVGIWEPQTLNESSNRAENLYDQTLDQVKAQAGYFSIRGELVFYSESEQKVIIKIKRRSQEKPSFFKLKLQGTLPEEGEKLGWFWEIDAQLKGEELVVTYAEKVTKLSDKSKAKKVIRNPKKIISKSGQKETPPSSSKPKPIPRRKKQRDRESN